MNEENIGVTRYTSHDYLRHNPTWDLEDSPWKARKVMEVLTSVNRTPASMCEVGCGAGGILVELRRIYPDAELFGYDISSDAALFWKKHDEACIHFELGDFFQLNWRHFEVLLLLDVIEHLENPFEFLSRLRKHADLFVFHIPLDLSACNIIRETPLMLARSRSGHVHYFTKRLALALLDDCRYEILTWRYTGAAFNSPKSNWKTKLVCLPRLLAYSIRKDWGVRLLGGETLMVLARAKG